MPSERESDAAVARRPRRTVGSLGSTSASLSTVTPWTRTSGAPKCATYREPKLIRTSSKPNTSRRIQLVVRVLDFLAISTMRCSFEGEGQVWSSTFRLLKDKLKLEL